MPVAWSSTWIGVMLSSGEAEAVTASEAAKLALHMQYVADEMGLQTYETIPIYVDATTAIAFAEKSCGTGRMKHIDIRSAWVRVLRDRKRISLCKVNGELNPADFMTKILNAKDHTSWVEKHTVRVKALTSRGDNQGGMEKDTVDCQRECAKSNKDDWK